MKFKTRQVEVDAYEFDGSIRSAAEIAMALDALEFDWDKDADVCGPDGPERRGPRMGITVDFLGSVALYAGDWLVVTPTQGDEPAQMRPFGPGYFVEHFEEKDG